MRKYALVAFLICFRGVVPAQSPTTNRLESLIGPSQFQLLAPRLGLLNKDIVNRGVHKFPGAAPVLCLTSILTLTTT